MAAITSISGLQNLSAGLTRFDARASGLQSVDLSNLPNLYNIDISDCFTPGIGKPSLTSVNLSGSTAVGILRLNESDFSGGIPNISTLTSLTYIDFAECNVSGILDFSGFPEMAAIDVNGNPVITSIIISDAQSIVFLNALGCGLTETAVDDILVVLDGNGVIGGTAYLNGGTNAVPSAIGLAALANLEANSWTISVNT